MAPDTRADRHGKEKDRSQSRSRSREKKRDPSEPRYQGQTYQRGAIFPRGEVRPPANYLTVSKSRPLELSVEFAKTVPLNDLKACDRFLRDHPEVLQEADLRKRYFDRAVDAFMDGDENSRILACSYLEKYTIIKCIQAYETQRKNFLRLLIARDPATIRTFKEAFGRAKEDAEEDAKKEARAAYENPSRHAPGQPKITEVTEGFGRLYVNRTSTSEVDRHGSGPVNDRQGSSAQGTSYRSSSEHFEEVDPGVAPPGRRERSRTQRAHAGEYQERGSFDDDGTEGATTPRAPLQDTRFQQLQPRGWRYFKPGRVFAIKMYSEDNSRPSKESDDYSMEGYRTTRGSQVYEKIHRMVVVKTRDAFCLAVPINTYGGQGLKKLGFTWDNINAHARIHMKDQVSDWLDNEPQSGKKAIAVSPENSYQRLHPASRVCFERTHSIDYNESLMKIGTVVPEDLTRLIEYWDEETQRKSRPGTKGKRHSSGGRGQGKKR